MVIYETAIPFVNDWSSKRGIHSALQSLEDSFQKAKHKLNLRVQEMSRNSTDETTTSITRDYELRFLGQVSDSVLTGEEIRGKDDTDIKIHLYDQATGNLVASGPESEATVEILFLDEVEDFDDSIIIANNKPRFRERVSVDLDKGVGTLPKNLKILRPKSAWMKKCKCRLGARVEKKFDGSTIKEAYTESFKVSDKRSVSCKNRDQPSLFDDVRTLKNIGKSGVRRERLRKSNVSTVQEFLFLLSVDPQGLEEVFGQCPGAWKSTKDHALKCNIDDKRIYYLHHSSSSSECRNGVVFDVVGQLKGVLRNNSYVPIQSVAEAEKDDARKLLAYAFKNQKEAPASRNKKKASAFENWYHIASSDDEASFLCKFPSSNDSNSSCHFDELVEFETLLYLFEKDGMAL